MSLLDNFPQSARDGLSPTAADVVAAMGNADFLTSVTSILSGANVRDYTEPLTQRRLTLITSGLTTLYAAHRNGGLTVRGLLEAASAAHQDKSRGPSVSDDRIVYRWILGLTKKQVDNVLRRDQDAWRSHVNTLADVLDRAAEEAAAQTTHVGPSVALNDELAANEAARDPVADWQWHLALMVAVGAATLTVRGSDKSLYGKLYERAVLHGALTVLGFAYSTEVPAESRHYNLSTTDRGGRESDATLYWTGPDGQSTAIKIDIGFIGRGNPEISRDKLSRYSRQVELGGRNLDIRTIVVVDTISPRSRIRAHANALDVALIEMNSPFWCKDLGDEVSRRFAGFASPLGGELSEEDCRNRIARAIGEEPLRAVDAADAED